MKNRGKKLLGLLLCVAIIIGMAAGMMPAAKADGKTISGLGTEAISNPTEPRYYDTPWQGSYVYFGGTNPLKYKVLTKKTSDFGGTTMLLDCDSILGDKEFDSEAPWSNTWNDSTLKAWLNGGDFLGARFTVAERAAIAASVKNGPAGRDGYSLQWATFVNLGDDPQHPDYIFLLDVREATRMDYGYWENPGYAGESRKKGGGRNNWWWLRSKYTSYTNGPHTMAVMANGKMAQVHVYSGHGENDDSTGVSPALNINLSSVIFTSEISSTDKTNKLTILDNDIGINPDPATRNRSVITVPYTLRGANQSEVTQVSIVMTNAIWQENEGWTVASGETLKKYYYGTLDTSNSFTLPTDYDSSWNTYIIAEDVNGEKETDYASAPVQIMIPHIHSFTYSASGAVITATCGNSGCPLPESKATLTITAPLHTTYGDGKEAAACIIDTNSIQGDAKVWYQTKDGISYGEIMEPPPSDAGDHKASITLGTATASVEYTIAQADSTANAPTGLTATYGQTLADVSLKNKNPAGNTPGTWAWADSTQSVGDAGTHTFKANFTPTDAINYNSKENVDVTVTVGKADSTAATITANNRTYDGTEKPLVTVDNSTLVGGTMKYALGTATEATEPYTTFIPAKTEAGTYYVWYKVEGDANHKDTEPESVTVVIAVKIVYTIASVDGGEHVIGEGKKATITVKRSVDDDKTFGLYTGSTMDGKKMPAGSHSAASGSLILTLNSSYLDTLSEGKHKVAISFSDGSADATITVKKPAPVPKTGDAANPMLWLAMILLGFLCAGGVIIRTAGKRR